MPFSSAERETVLSAIQNKAPQVGICSVCSRPDWTIADGFVFLNISDRANVLGGPSMPCVAIVCTNCGNTVLLNAMILGLQGLLDPKGQSRQGS